jgi:hypothetical protein
MLVQHLLWGILQNKEFQEERLFLFVLYTIRLTIVVLPDKAFHFIVANPLIIG